MTKETFMMSFSKDGIVVNNATESNSIIYKFDIAGATDYSVAPYIKRNDIDITQTYGNGLNVREFNSVTDKGAIKSFELTAIDSTMNNAFNTFIESSTAKLIIIFSGKKLRSSDSIDSNFSKWKSTVWPKKFLCNNYSCGYVGIYSPELKRIVYESMVSSDGADKNQAILTATYDDFTDIGSLGFSNKAIYDGTEYSTSNGYEYKKYPTDNISNLMSDYGLDIGKPVFISADIYQSSELLDAEMNTQIQVQWLAGNVVKDTINLTNSNKEWSRIEKYLVPSSDVDSFNIVVSRYPKNDSIVALSSIKNFVMTQVSKNGDEIKNNGGIIGINGIRSSELNIGNNIADNIINMPLNANTLNNTIDILDITEK